MARERSERTAQRMREGMDPERYGYADRPLREEILETLEAPPEAACIVTRNAYGCRVMNTAGAMFVDVDFPEDALRRRGPSLLGRIFGRRVPDIDPLEALQKDALAKLVAVVGDAPGFGARVYRTAAGLRYLVTHDLFDPAAPEVLDVMERVEADPLYVRLCKAQACFRARLTPKPWRCAMQHPPWRHPREGDALRRFRNWLKEYEERQKAYATCSFVAHLGETRMHAAVEPVVAQHDRETRVESGLPLA